MQQIERYLDHCLNHSAIMNSALAPYFERFRQQEQILRIKELDNLVFERMYQKTPSPSEALKIRYWRSGYTLPATRTECIRLAFALRMSREELDHFLMYSLQESGLYLLDIRDFVYASFLSENNYDFQAAESLILSCMPFLTASQPTETPLKDRFLQFHEMKPPQPSRNRIQPVPVSSIISWVQKNSQVFNEAYAYQEWLLLSVCYRYLVQTPIERLEELKIKPGQQYGHLRHILYSELTDCLNIPLEEDHYRMHIYSRDFSSEINRYFKRGAFISRSTFIRLILLFTLPDLDTASVNTLLTSFGYAPLSSQIHTPSGACPDALLMLLLKTFDKKRTGHLPTDRTVFKKLLRDTDQLLCEKLQSLPVSPKGSAEYRSRMLLKDLRLMAFRSFRKEIL